MSVSHDLPNAPPAPPNAAWQRAAGDRETAAPLARLPDGLVLDDTIDEPLWYDPARRRLVYRGFMCNASYVYLRRRSNDRAFIDALEKLYLGSAEEEPTATRSLGRIAVRLTAAATLAGAAGWLWTHW